VKRVLSGWLLIVATGLWQQSIQAQIDPEKRQLLQFGYNQPLEGKGPLAGYLFYYRNDPGFLRSNITLRLAVAPIYLDTELGFAGLLGPQTDFGLGLSGGGFADSYYEIHRGNLRDDQSFIGHGGEISGNIYHRFNPDQRIPLNGILRLGARASVYERDSDTAANFVLPDDRELLFVRAGLRWGGREPTMSPDVSMELSLWYEGQYRTDSGSYGFAGDRSVESATHLFWARALLNCPLPNWKHDFGIGLTAGASIDADRFSAYRLGGVLPLVSEFPLSIPGYFFEELSADKFILANAQYSLPIDSSNRFSITIAGSIAAVDYLEGFEQPGHFHSGVAGGVRYRSPSDSWRIVVAYAYGFDAIRDGNRGAQSIGILLQWDLEAKQRHRDPYLDIESPYKSRGLFRFLGQ
jgi:hypothetical protein